ncbi:MAG: hypothetical protein ACFFAS_03930 [Promethearchaeota archaeon]
MIIIVAAFPFYDYWWRPDIPGYLPLIFGGWLGLGFIVAFMFAIKYSKITLARIMGILGCIALVVNLVAIFVIFEELRLVDVDLDVTDSGTICFIFALIIVVVTNIELNVYLYIEKNEANNPTRIKLALEPSRLQYCSMCGFQLHEEFTYCPNCNTQIREQANTQISSHKISSNKVKEQQLLFGCIILFILGIIGLFFAGLIFGAITIIGSLSIMAMGKDTQARQIAGIPLILGIIVFILTVVYLIAVL